MISQVPEALNDTIISILAILVTVKQVQLHLQCREDVRQHQRLYVLLLIKVPQQLNLSDEKIILYMYKYIHR